ncbi:hypothetical protein RFI_13470, partial [Reticulomyxa filosa]
KTKDSIRAGVEGVLGADITKQAIEFWSSCADAELKIKYDKKRGSKDQQNKTVGSVSKAMPEIVPIYLKALAMHSDDEPDEDEWDVRKASGCSLELFAQVVGDEILDPVCKFVAQNVRSEVLQIVFFFFFFFFLKKQKKGKKHYVLFFLKRAVQGGGNGARLCDARMIEKKKKKTKISKKNKIKLNDQ